MDAGGRVGDDGRVQTWRTSGRGELVLVGGGGHALGVAEAARTAGYMLAGYLDDAPDAVLSGLDDPPVRLGGLTELSAIGDRHWILAVGSLARRRALLEELASSGSHDRAAFILHPAAAVSPSAGIDAGTWVGPGAVVHTNAALAPHCIVNSGAIVEHECRIDHNSHIAPGATLGGRVVIGAGTLVGLGSTVLPGVRIGTGCVIGAGAVVTGDVPDRGRVAGVPARAI